jgi:hypothetical protein
MQMTDNKHTGVIPPDRPMLPVAQDLAFPLEAATQTFAILAKRGVGKTYLALVMMEQMLKAGLHVVIIDPVGVCWGLRASADGEHPGLPIVVLGGDHGDVPLEASAGEVIADFVISQRQSVVLDLSLFRKGEQDRFVTDFAERLYQRNRDPLHLLLDEADAFAPQRPMKGQERMLGAIEDIVRRGRARGLGVSLVTQRAAVLNKNVLTQVEVLIALRTIAPQDRNAIDAWIETHGTPEQRAVLMASLPSLPIGTAWVWSPGWLDLFQRIQVRPRETFDSSATPKVGEVRLSPRALAPVDLTALRARIASTLEQAKLADPAFLRKRIAELERQLQQQAKLAPVREVIKPIIERVEVPVFHQGEIERLEQALATLHSARVDVERIAHEIQAALPMAQQRVLPPKAHIPALEVPRQQTPILETGKTPGQDDDDEKQRVLRAGERKMLEVLARHYPLKVTRAQLAMFAGFAASGGTFGNYLNTLKRNGFSTEPARNEVLITEAGLAYLGMDRPPRPLTHADYIAMWQGTLRAGERRMFDTLLAVYPGTMTRQELAGQIEMALSGGTFSNYLGTLKRNGLIEMTDDRIRICDMVFQYQQR